MMDHYNLRASQTGWPTLRLDAALKGDREDATAFLNSLGGRREVCQSWRD